MTSGSIPWLSLRRKEATEDPSHSPSFQPSVLETRQLVVRTAGNQVASHSQRRARILEEAAQPDPVEAADLQERKFGRDAISLAPTVVRGFDETFVATRKFRKIAQEQLTDGFPPLQRVGEQAIDNEVVGASSKGSDSDTNRPLSGCWWGRRPRGHQRPELCQQPGGIVGGLGVCRRQEPPQRLTQSHVLVPSTALALVRSHSMASAVQAFSMPPGILQR